MNKKLKSGSSKKKKHNRKKKTYGKTDLYSDIIYYFSKYREEFQKKGYSLVASILRSIGNLLQTVSIDDIISSLITASYTPPIHEIALGYAYVKRALNKGAQLTTRGEAELYIGIIWPIEEFSEAIKYLDIAVETSPDKAILYTLIKFCFEMVGDFEKSSITNDKLQETFNELDQNSKEIVDDINLTFYRHRHLRIAGFYILSEDYEIIDKLEKELEKIIIDDPTDEIAMMLLIHIYYIKDKFEEYFNLLRKWSKNNNNSIPYEALARIYLSKKEYKAASDYFKKARELYDNDSRSEICDILYEFSLGLENLYGKYSSEENGTTTYHKHFYKCKNLIEKYKIESFAELKLLPSILELNKQRSTLFSFSSDLYEIIAKVENMHDNLMKILDKWKLPDQYFGDINNIVNPINSVLYILQTYIFYIGYILRIPRIFEIMNKVLKDANLLEDNFWKESIAKSQKLLSEQLVFKEGGLIFVKLKLFKERIRGRSIDEISDEESSHILNEMTRGMKEEKNEIVTKGINQYIFNIFGDVCNIFGDKVIPEITEKQLKEKPQREQEKKGFEEKIDSEKDAWIKLEKRMKWVPAYLIWILIVFFTLNIPWGKLNSLVKLFVIGGLLLGGIVALAFPLGKSKTQKILGIIAMLCSILGFLWILLKN